MAGSCCGGVGPSSGGVPLATTRTQPVTGTTAAEDPMMAQLAALGITGGSRLNGVTDPAGVNSQGLSIFA